MVKPRVKYSFIPSRLIVSATNELSLRGSAITNRQLLSYYFSCVFVSCGEMLGFPQQHTGCVEKLVTNFFEDLCPSESWYFHIYIHAQKTASDLVGFPIAKKSCHAFATLQTSTLATCEEKMFMVLQHFIDLCTIIQSRLKKRFLSCFLSRHFPCFEQQTMFCKVSKHDMD
jgi:hypothetical protein